MDIDGTWKGTCTRNGNNSFEIEWPVHLVGKEKIIIAGQEFFLGKKVVTETYGDDPQGKKFWEKITLNWHFNSDETEIITNKEMEGRYLDGSGNWTTSGSGTIRLNNEQLEIKRKFKETFNGVDDVTDEVCLLKK